MPAEIVTETCPAPECNLSEKEIEQSLDEMTNYMEMFSPAFQRVEQLRWSKTYLRGLLGNASRKNVEQMALEQGENVRSMQYFAGRSPWEEEPVLAIHQQSVGDTLGEEDGVALIDESSAVKQGDDSVGVARQYCGSVGKVANGQVGVYLGYASRKGYSLVEGRLFMPDEWFEEDHAERRKTCGVPEDLVYKTKPEIGLNWCKKLKNAAICPSNGWPRTSCTGIRPRFGTESTLWESGISLKSRIPPPSGAPSPKCMFPSGKVAAAVQPACVCAIRATVQFR